MDPLVSIITPTCRRRDLLIRARDSVRLQTDVRWEHIIVSDGPDSLPDDVHRWYRTRHFELGWRHGRDGRGGSIARMIGTHMARGKYICYLDDDDEFLPNHLSVLTTALETSGYDFAWSKMAIVVNGRDTGRECGKPGPIKGGIGTGSLMHRTQLIQAGNWYDDPHERADDWLLVKSWLDKGAKGLFVDVLTYLYHMRPQ